MSNRDAKKIAEIAEAGEGATQFFAGSGKMVYPTRFNVKTSRLGLLVKAKTSQLVTPEMVKELSEDDPNQ